MYIIMLGAPGTGKGTIGKILAEDLKLKHIATGDIFREQISNQTEIGQKIEDYMAKGLLVPDDITMEIVTNRLLKDDVKNGAILDGFPRTYYQAKALQEFLLKNNSNLKVVAIELNVPDDEIVKRIINRVTCSNKSCGEIYNLEKRPPKKEGICNICGSKLKKRADDNEETVKRRLEVYHSNSNELLDFYRDNKELYSVYQEEVNETIRDIEDYLKTV